MDTFIEVMARHYIQWSVTSVPNGEDGETLYAVWIVMPGIHGVWAGDGPTVLEALQNALDFMMRHVRQACPANTRPLVDKLRADLGELSPR
jgi:hypothetical protein